MSLFFGRSQRASSSDLLAERGRLSSAIGRVTPQQARRHSVVWAAQRLRADLVSMMPIDVYRQSPGGGGIQVKVSSPPVLVEPWETAEGHPMGIGEWMYSTQVSFDSAGNIFGVVRSRDAFGKPAKIEPLNPDDVSLMIRGSRITSCRINGEKLELEDLWHERQHTIAGLPIGLSPIAYAALTLQTGLAAQEFAFEWFTNGAAPSGHLRNVEQTLNHEESVKTQRRFLASQRKAGGLFVSGKDWEYSSLSAKAAESGFVEQSHLTDIDLCRFLGVPADVVDVAVDSSTINYANITQRNLQLLVMHLGPSIKRREDALSRVTATPRFVKLNRAALLAMDEKSRAELFALQIESRTRTPDQVRAIDDQPPLGEAEYAQFDRLFGPRTKTPTQTSGGN